MTQATGGQAAGRASRPKPIDPGRLGLLLALLAGAALRFLHLGWGLRHAPHMDEQYFVRNVERMLRTGSFDHGFYEYPGLLFYLLAPVLAAVGVTDPPGPSAYLAARALAAAFGVAAVGLGYAFGKRLLGRPAGLVAAWFLALSPVHVETAHRLRADVVLEALTLLCFLALLRLGRDWRDDARAGAAAGLCLGLKFSAGLLAVPYLAQRLLRPGPRLRGLALGALAAGVVFVVVSPYALLNSGEFARGAATQVTYHYQERAAWAPSAPYWERLLGYVAVWPKALGVPGALLATVGLGLLLTGRPRPFDSQALAAARARRGAKGDPYADAVYDLTRSLLDERPPPPPPRARDVLPFLLLPPLTAAVFATTGYHFDRHMLPSFAVVALLGGYCVQVVHRRLPTAGLFLAFGALAFPAYASLRYLEAIGRPGTRERAAAWVEERLPDGARVLSSVPQLALDPRRFELRQERLTGPLAAVLVRSVDATLTVPQDEAPGVFDGLPPAVVIEPRSAFEGPAIAVRLVPPEARPRLERLPLQGARLRSSAGEGALDALRDGRLDTYWDVETRPDDDAWVELAWDEPRHVARVELLLGGRPREAGGRLRLHASRDGATFERLPSVRGRPSVRKQRLVDDDASEVLLFAPVEARALRIVRPGGSRAHAAGRWSVAELAVWGDLHRPAGASGAAPSPPRD